jgi:hypothetical protein
MDHITFVYNITFYSVLFHQAAKSFQAFVDKNLIIYPSDVDKPIVCLHVHSRQ